MLTLITCTGDRPAGFALCERWMARQSRQWGRWIVIDDGHEHTTCTMGQEMIRRQRRSGEPPHTLILNLLAALERLKRYTRNDRVLFIEDDDWYSPRWLEAMDTRLDHCRLAGESHAVYYHIAERRWADQRNARHASLCASGFRGDLLSRVIELCRQSSDPFLDLRLWRDVPNESKLLFAPGSWHGERHLTVGIKGLPGRRGIGSGHQAQTLGNFDIDGSKLRELVGEDANLYALALAFAGASVA